MRRESEGAWRNLLYFPSVFGSSNREPLVLSERKFVEVSFKDTDIQNVRFIRCIFERCLFIGVSISQCEFTDCRFVDTNTNKLKITESLVDPEDFKDNFDLKSDTNIAIDLYHQIYKNSLEQHQPRFAIESLYSMKEAERHHLASQHRRGVITKRKFYFSAVKFAFYDFTSGYGLRFGKVARFAAIVIFALTLLNYLFRAQIFQSGALMPFIDVFYFTCVTVTTLGYGDIVPVTSGGKLWVIVQTISGFGVLSLVLSAVANMALRGR